MGLGAWTGGMKGIGSASVSISQGRRDTGNLGHGGDRLRDTVMGLRTSQHRPSVWGVCWRPLGPSCPFRQRRRGLVQGLPLWQGQLG